MHDTAVTTTAADAPGQPRRSVSTLAAISVIVGIVIGAGIFTLPSIVAGNVTSTATLMGVWLAGGIISLIGALCYAELASAYPDAGGDYHFLHRAYGSNVAFLFAWARMTVIQPGSIALLAFVIGDYATGAMSLGNYSTAIYAAAVVVLVTGVNVMGIRTGAAAQLISTVCVVLGLLVVTAAGFLGPAAPPAATQLGSEAVAANLGVAMVLVLLTYGGWNEAAYLSAEIRNPRGIVTALLVGIAIITAIYILANASMLHALGRSGMAGTQTLAADIMRNRFGEAGAWMLTAAVIFAALSTANATAMTGGRSNYALGRDFPLFAPLGRWSDTRGTPVTALLVQGGIALALILFGAWMPSNENTMSGLERMVQYTAPVFWAFFLLTGVSLFVLRRREPSASRPFRVPFYPFTPLLFCAACVYVLQSSLFHYGKGALVGIAVLLAGVPLLVLARVMASVRTQPAQPQV